MWWLLFIWRLVFLHLEPKGVFTVPFFRIVVFHHFLGYQKKGYYENDNCHFFNKKSLTKKVEQIVLNKFPPESRNLIRQPKTRTSVDLTAL